ncbi:hypothetical protein EIP86_011211 [Pleurotus ostreatoroseus]|nr:hypothetical protein EIP86_011211 [Pleurotus ostreatoroseus]
MLGFGKPQWDPRGKHCFVTGGSAGLGLGVALSLVKRGAHVSIIARDQGRLDKALSELENHRQTPEQVIKAYSFAIDTAKGAEDALDAASEPHDNRVPNAMFLCAGKSRPGFFVEQTEESLTMCMQETYWAQAWSALAATKRMVKDGVHGKIVFVGSILSYFSMVGYSTYSPGKFAVRGLAETLHSEFKLYGIDVHMFFPGTILSPGYVEENKVKPEITLKIEEDDKGRPPEELAEYLIKGIQQGRFHITYDFISNIFRATSKGSSPGNSGILDQVYNLLGSIALPLWRRDVDNKVKKHAPQHHEYLEQKRKDGSLKL